MNKVVVVVLGIIRKENKYLFTNRITTDYRDKGIVTKDFWQFPGGGLEFGESPEQTCIREVKEETGLDIKIVTQVPHIITDKRPQYKWHGIVISYLCEMIDPQQKIVLEAESTKYQWLSAKEARGVHSFPGIPDLINAAEKL